MIIYVTGDSFSDGTGLGDYILDNYPGDILADQFFHSPIDERLDWQEYVYRSGKFDLVRCAGKKLAWGQLISDKTDNTVINGSYPGSTITAIFLRMVNDFESYGIPEKVFISLPNANRIPIFIRTANTLEEMLLSITPVSHDLYTANQKNLAEAYWKEYTDEENLIFYLRDILTIEQYVKEKTGNFPIWIDSIFLDALVKTYKKSVLPLTSMLWNQTQIKNYDSILSMSKILDKSDTYTADGHFGRSVHIKIADAIIKNYL